MADRIADQAEGRVLPDMAWARSCARQGCPPRRRVMVWGYSDDGIDRQHLDLELPPEAASTPLPIPVRTMGSGCPPGRWTGT